MTEGVDKLMDMLAAGACFDHDGDGLCDSCGRSMLPDSGVRMAQWPAVEEPLTDEEQAMIDAAWQTHRDALNVAGSQPSDRPKTLLDGFGEATDQVVALRAEVDRLQADLADYKRGAEEEAHQGDMARAEVHRLNGIIELLEDENIRLEKVVEAQGKVVSEAKAAVAVFSGEPIDQLGLVRRLSRLGRELKALDQATTPPEATQDKCGYESLPDEPGRFCRLLKGHAGHHSETPGSVPARLHGSLYTSTSATLVHSETGELHCQPDAKQCQFCVAVSLHSQGKPHEEGDCLDCWEPEAERSGLGDSPPESKS